ncbi:MAG: aminocarboxymuconate-semialdehyde decarboxylase [Betaproteobacteria bacterium]|nr:aminocarboxymuconate-semialdehyde decarboxylase [Betaproteobacteria bacterium]
MNTGREVTNDGTAASRGIVFTGCSVTEAAHETRLAAAGGAAGAAATPAARRREVLVKGKRVKTIDVHAHCIVPAGMSALGMNAADHHQDGIVLVPQERLRAMDEQGIDVEALSINPFWYKANRDQASEVVRFNNEGLAELCASAPDRFVAFASVALQFPDLAVQQLEHAVRKLGLRGAAVGASCAGDEFSDPKFHPFWAKCEELGILVFLHPQGTPDLARRLKGNGVLDNVIGNPLDTTIALSHLIFEGTLDRFPGLKICSAHGGGYIASYMDRSDHGCVTFPDRCTRTLKKKPTEYLKQMYYDALIFTPEALRHLAANVGSSQIMMGTDYPYPWDDKTVDHIMNTPGFTDEEKIAMLGGTAAKLLGIN